MDKILSLMQLHNLDKFYVSSLMKAEDIEPTLEILQGTYEDMELEKEILKSIRKDINRKIRKGVIHA